MRIRLLDVTVDIGRSRIVHDGQLIAESGRTTGLIGPNGSGKSTLLRTVYRALAPTTGSVRVGGHEVWELSARASARLTSVVLQDDVPDFDFTVREVVGIGRVPHSGVLGRTSRDDEEIVSDALVAAGVERLAGRMVRTLSGGERQRVFLARALAQQTPVLVLDEPTNHLDVRAQLDLFELLATLPLTVVAAIHDLNLAGAYCDHLVLLDGGRVVASGPATQVLTPPLLAQVYGVDSVVATNPLTGRPAVHLGPTPGTPPARPPFPAPERSHDQKGPPCSD